MAGNRVARAAFQTVLETIFPPHCLGCGEMVSELGALCPDCWREAHFISGLVCDKCGVPLPGECSDQPELCDDCMTIARPWAQGRAVLVYKGTGRKLVLALKHADRQEIAPPAARWMIRTLDGILTTATVIAPVPLHWTRFWKRRYNQSALLANAIAKQSGATAIPDLLHRKRRTRSLDGLSRDERFALMQGRLTLNPRFQDRIKGRNVLLVDDVMTSGATLAAATEACHVAGAAQVCIVALARVQKDA